MPRIFIGEVHVDTIMDSSGLFYGHNVLCNWRSSEKANHGFGEVSGQGSVVRTELSILGDQDNVDTFISSFKAQSK